jgi:hypothetical protein
VQAASLADKVNMPTPRLPNARRQILCCIALLAGLMGGRARAEPAGPAQREREEAAGQAPETAALTSANPLGYQRLMALGLDEFERGHWAEARALFWKGHLLSPSARSFRALGMTAFNLQRYPEALRELTHALADARRPLTAGLRSSTRELLERVDTFVGRYQVRIEPAQAELRVDGLSTQLEPDGSLLLAVGAHVLELEASGYAQLRRPLVVDGSDGEKLRLSLLPLALGAPPRPVTLSVGRDESAAPQPARAFAAAPPDRGAGRSRQLLRDYRWTFGLGGATVGFLGGAIGVQVMAYNEQRDLEQRCAGGTCNPQDGETDRRDDLRRASAALWVTSAVFAVTTLVMGLVEGKRVAEREAKRRHSTR